MFKGRHFERSMTPLYLRRHLAYNLSLHNLEEMMAERGISVDHATIIVRPPTMLRSCWSASVHARKPSPESVAVDGPLIAEAVRGKRSLILLGTKSIKGYDAELPVFSITMDKQPPTAAVH